MEYFTRIYH